MKSGMGKKAGTRIFAGALAGVIIVFALVSAFYIHNFDQTLLEENQSHLAEVADHIVTYIQAAVEDTLDTLETAADALPLMEQEECVGYMRVETVCFMRRRSCRIRIFHGRITFRGRLRGKE